MLVTEAAKGVSTSLAHGRHSKKLELAKRDFISSLQDERKNKLKHLLVELMDYKSHQEIADEDFTEVLEFVLSSYVENEVNDRVNHLLRPVMENLRLKLR